MMSARDMNRHQLFEISVSAKKGTTPLPGHPQSWRVPSSRASISIPHRASHFFTEHGTACHHSRTILDKYRLFPVALSSIRF